jgi:hypothetical protein
MSSNLKQTETSNDNEVVAPVAAGMGGTPYNDLPPEVQAFITGIISVLSYNWPWPDQFHDGVLGAIRNFENSNQLGLASLNAFLKNIQQ